MKLSHHTDIRHAARAISLLRVLLLSLAVLTLTSLESRGLTRDAQTASQASLVALVAVMAVLLVLTAVQVRSRVQLFLHLVFDLLWVACVVYFTGGVVGPAVPLIYAVVLIGDLLLPGVLPFALAGLAATALTANAALSLAGFAPMAEPMTPGTTANSAVISSLAVQIPALFFIDMLAQSLTRRWRDQQLLTDDLLEQLGDGVIAIDRERRILFSNHQAFDLLGIPVGETGDPLDSILTGDIAPRIKELIREGKPALEHRLSPEGRWLRLRYELLRGSRGRLVGTVLTIADETDLKRLEDNVRRSEHLAQLGEMAAGIAHEIRNPLTCLRGCAQEIAETSSGKDQDQGDLARIVVSESDRLARIVDDVLGAARLRPALPEAVDLSTLWGELEQLYHRRADLPEGLVLEWRLPHNHHVLADPDHMRQIIVNLVNNAIDAVRKSVSPWILVTAERIHASGVMGGEPMVEIRVVDNGCGIASGQRERIFTPFYSTKAQGTGLGLSLVQRLVQEHKGVLDFSPSAQGGTEVRLVLPDATVRSRGI